MDLDTILIEFEQSQLDLKTKLNSTILKLEKFSAQVPHPALGQTYLRWQILAKVAATNLNLAKWFESHLDAISIQHELGIENIAKGLWAIWAAEGSKIPITLEDGACSGQKNWCSGAGLIQNALLTYKDSNQHSQLISIDMNQSDIDIDYSPWQAVGMQHTQTASIHFNRVRASKVGEPNQYLTRRGFWHGAAGVAACWFGATQRIAEFLTQACQQQSNDYRLMYLGEINTALATTRQYFRFVANKIDAEPNLSHELIIRILRAQVENTAQLVLDKVGKALGARPFCENQIFAQLTADLPVFLRQSHAAFDLKNIAELSLKEGSAWNL